MTEDPEQQARGQETEEAPVVAGASSKRYGKPTERVGEDNSSHTWIEVQAWLLGVMTSDLPTHAKAMLAYMASKMDEEGKIRLEKKVISQELGIAVATVNAHYERIAKSGFVRSAGIFVYTSGPNRYRLPVWTLITPMTEQNTEQER